MIRFNCQLCGRLFEATDDLVGRFGRCQVCGHRMQVPVPAPGPRISEIRSEPPPLPVDDRTGSDRSSKPQRPPKLTPAGVVVALVVILVLGALSYYFVDSGVQQFEQQAEREFRNFGQFVARDAEHQYKIAQRNGSAMDAFVRAGFVAECYLQAGDESNYRYWKSIERQEARRAGIPW